MKKTSTLLYPFAFILGASLMVPLNTYANEELNVYSGRKQQLIKPLLDKFSGQTGIKVNLITGKADALLQRLKKEGINSPADILITTDAGRLHRAKEAGVLQAAISKEMQDKISTNLHDKDNYWLGLTKRARVIVYAKDRVKASDLSTYEGLTDAKWKGRICIRSSGNIYNQSLVASMVVSQGEEATASWAKGIVANMARKPKGGDKDQIKAVAAGQCDVAVVNTYYLGQMINSKKEGFKEAAAKVALFWPNQNDRGAHINVSGIAVTKAAKNADNAKKLINFMLSEESQAWYSEVNNEYPVVKGVAASKTLQNWGDFKADELNLTQLGDNNSKAVKLMDKAGWK